MDDIFFRLAEANGGYFARHELLDSGFADDHIRQALKDRSIVRIRHGTYAPAAAYAALSPEGRHRILAHSVADRLGHAVAISHVSAATDHQLDTFGFDLNVVHLTRLDNSNGRHEAGVVHHKGLVVADKNLREIDGRLVIEPMRAVIETCTLAPIESGMVTASSALRLELGSQDELLEMAAKLDRWRGIRGARMACQLSDKLFESVGEVRSFHMFWRWGLPKPELQFQVFDSRGRLIGRTDFGWPEYRHVGEFDGLVKYGRLNPYSDNPGQVIVDEKLREDAVRGEELGMSRWVWAGLNRSQQGQTIQMIQRGLERSRRLYLRNAVTISLS